MVNMKYFLTGIFLCACLGLWAKEVRDTLKMSNGDRVYVTYDQSNRDGQIKITNLNVRKDIKKTCGDKYQQKKVNVVFFDKIGGYGNDVEFSGMTPDLFMIPSGINYIRSDDGYFLLTDNNNYKLIFESKLSEAAELSIPMYLANYKKRKCYELFCRCGDLKIKIPGKKTNNTHVSSTNTQLTTQTITTQEEVEDPQNVELQANFLIENIRNRLSKEEKLPFSEDLVSYKKDLDKLLLENITNKSLVKEIKEVLEEYDNREKELNRIADAKAAAAAKEAEEMAKREEARQDSIKAAAQQKEEAERKQTLWLIIGGVILAILAFVGNQVFQHFRNVKNYEMQANAVKRAENEAKRRARNMAQSQVNRAQGEVRRKTRGAINDGINKIVKKGKGNKGVSI